MLDLAVVDDGYALEFLGGGGGHVQGQGRGVDACGEEDYCCDDECGGGEWWVGHLVGVGVVSMMMGMLLLGEVVIGMLSDGGLGFAIISIRSFTICMYD